MISDVLSDAIFEIRRYQEEFASTYAPMREEIDRVVSEMEGLRIELDIPPGPAFADKSGGALQ